MEGDIFIVNESHWWPILSLSLGVVRLGASRKIKTWDKFYGCPSFALFVFVYLQPSKPYHKGEEKKGGKNHNLKCWEMRRPHKIEACTELNIQLFCSPQNCVV